MLPCERHTHLSKAASLENLFGYNQISYKNDTKIDTETIEKPIQKSFPKEYGKNIENIGNNITIFQIWVPIWEPFAPVFPTGDCLVTTWFSERTTETIVASPGALLGQLYHLLARVWQQLFPRCLRITYFQQ